MINPVFLLLALVYLALLIFTVLRILLDTQSTPKTLGYLFLVVIVPVFGIAFYFSFGVNLRQRHVNTKGAEAFKRLDENYKKEMPDLTGDLLQAQRQQLGVYATMVSFLHTMSGERLSFNEVKLLRNGEVKFPELLETLERAESFIHLEYYAWENDVRGNQIKDVLLERARAGVKVRALFDDYASRKIKHNIVKQLRAGGVEIYPVIKVKLKLLANRVNHRDHRKIVIVDGKECFVGGINLSDRYDNSIDTGLYWRDTHVKITGSLAASFQRHFLSMWNNCQPNELTYSKELFPLTQQTEQNGRYSLAQVVGGGPIFKTSTIMLSYLRLFSLAENKLWITNPYFIPSDSILDALKQAAYSGVDVRLMLPDKSDSMIVGAASRFYFAQLLQAGVKIFLYKKGFVHAKTVVADGSVSIVGTANMDIRSFDLNFEMMSVIYSPDFAREMEEMFENDLKECRELNADDWGKLSLLRRLGYSVARLISAFL